MAKTVSIDFLKTKKALNRLVDIIDKIDFEDYARSSIKKDFPELDEKEQEKILETWILVYNLNQNSNEQPR